MNETFKDIKEIYFIGIGGIGVSAIARMMLGLGKKVSGEDSSLGKITEELEKLGAVVFQSEKEPSQGAVLARLQGADLVVYSIAVPETHPVLLEAKNRGLRAFSYPEMLGHLSSKMKTVAVSGTHGKTTTTAMVADILIDAELSPMVIVGSLLKSGTNFIEGWNDILVVEACEYRRSFLNLKPHILIITNIDEDHLDYYKDLADIQSAFVELAGKMGPEDYIVCDTKSENLKPVIESTKAKVIDYTSENKFSLKVPGKHNVLNAQAASAVGRLFNVPDERIKKSLENFSGTWRRFEYKGTTKNGALVYDDYGHHPTEIQATLQGTRELFPDKKIIAVFQPHLFSRTKTLFNEFSQSFHDADEVVLLPIYAAREAYDESISSEQLAEAIRNESKNNKEGDKEKSSEKKITALASLEEASAYLSSHTTDNDVVLLTGAGDVYTIAPTLF